MNCAARRRRRSQSVSAARAVRGERSAADRRGLFRQRPHAQQSPRRRPEDHEHRPPDGTRRCRPYVRPRGPRLERPHVARQIRADWRDQVGAAERGAGREPVIAGDQSALEPGEMLSTSRHRARLTRPARAKAAGRPSTRARARCQAPIRSRSGPAARRASPRAAPHRGGPEGRAAIADADGPQAVLSTASVDAKAANGGERIDRRRARSARARSPGRARGRSSQHRTVWPRISLGDDEHAIGSARSYNAPAHSERSGRPPSRPATPARSVRAAADQRQQWAGVTRRGTGEPKQINVGPSVAPAHERESGGAGGVSGRPCGLVGNEPAGGRRSPARKPPAGRHHLRSGPVCGRRLAEVRVTITWSRSGRPRLSPPSGNRGAGAQGRVSSRRA